MKNIILDTDLYNEIDDQIALAYVLKSKNTLNLEAVTIAPFTKGEYNTKTSIDKSYEVAKKYLKCVMKKIIKYMMTCFQKSQSKTEGRSFCLKKN